MKPYRPEPDRRRALAYVIDQQADRMASHPVPEDVARRMAEHLTHVTKRPHVIALALADRSTPSRRRRPTQ